MKFSPSSSTKTSLVSIFVIMTSNSYSTMLSSTYFSSLPEVYLAPVLSLTQTSFKLLPLHWDSEQVNLYMSSLRTQSVSHSPPAFLDVSPTDFQSHVMGVCLLSAGPPGWGVPCGAWTPCSLWGSMVMISLQLMGCHTRRVDSDSD